MDDLGTVSKAAHHDDEAEADDDGDEGDVYIARVDWWTPTALMVQVHHYHAIQHKHDDDEHDVNMMIMRK